MSERMLKVNEALRKEIAFIIERDLKVADVLITVTGVDCAPDLKGAKIWVSIWPENKMGSAIERLRKSSGFIRGKLGKKIKLRQMPKLHFVIDDTEKYAAEIEKIISDL